MTVTLRFPDLAPPITSVRDIRQWLPSPEALVDACEAACASGEPAGLTELLAGVGAPVLDMITTPMAARASLMGAATGRAFFHHELRRRLPMPPALEPEVAVWDEGTVPVWRDGVLTEPKYFSFFQDAPLPAFNPNHRRKWRGHELLHGAVRFFWHPAMTRFEMYVSARINELLPIIHWYGLDEVFRPRCPRHTGQLLHREYCQACEDAARPYWTTDAAWREERRGDALRFIGEAWEHLETEWAAVCAEIETGRVHETPRPRLNASSDAVGYMRAHWNRVTAWSFGHWMELFMVDGVDYFSTLSALAEHSAHATRDFVSGDLSLAKPTFEALRGRRQLQDMGYRVTLALEWLEEGSAAAVEAEQAIMPELERAAELSRRILDNPAAAADVMEHLYELTGAFAEVTDHFPDVVAKSFFASGYLWEDAEANVDAGLPQLVEGLHSALPETADDLAGHLDTVLRDFAHSPVFGELGRLGSRFARWVLADERKDVPEELTAFEAWASDEPRYDEEAELFGTLPADADDFATRPARLRAHRTLRRRPFSSALLAGLTGDPALEDAPPEQPVGLAVVHMRGELRLIVEDDATAQVLDMVKAGRTPADIAEAADWTSVESLLDNGFIVWLPLPE